MECPFDNDPVDEGAALLRRELNIRREMVYQFMNRLKKDSYRPITRHLCLGGDELPPGIPSATGLPIFWFRASTSASVRGGGAGPPPVLRAFAFFLLAE